MSIQSAFDAIRFYTVLDPYYYTVDNRPLLDMETNQNLLAEAGDAVFSANKSVAVAAGFTMRGYAQENHAVGQISFPTNMTFVVERAILNQALPISLTDLREVPHLGLQVDSIIIGPFSAAVTPGFERPFLVEARKIDATASTPHYDAGNTFSPDAFIVGDIEFQILTGADVPIGSGLFNIPSPTTGWVPLFKVVLPEGSATVDAPDVYYGTPDARFNEEGALLGGGGSVFELNVDTRIATPNQQTFSALVVNAEFALVFVDGLFQSGVTVINSSTVDLPEPVPAGTVVDFVTTAGGSYTEGTVKRDTRVTVASQQIFGSLLVNAFFASVYVQGVYQDTFTVIDSQTIQLAAPIPANTRITFEEKSAGIADLGIIMPPGGAFGYVLTKDSGADYDFSWQPGGGMAAVPNGGNTGQVLTKNSPADQDTIWAPPAGGPGPVVPFSIETQISTPSQLIFVVASDPSTMLVFRDGVHITDDITAVMPNQIVISPAASNLPEEFVFVQTGGGSLDAVTIQKENDLQLILNSRNAFLPPAAAINDVESLANDVLVAGSVSSSELWKSVDGGQTWAVSTPGNLPTGIYGLAYNGSRLVAVGEGGATSYSDNSGATWTVGFPIGGVTALSSVTWDSTNSLFIAVGDGGILATSADGGATAWATQVLDGGIIDFTDVHFANARAVAVGVNGSVENIYTATDGVTWSAAATSGLTGGFNKVYWGTNAWFAAGENEIATSITGDSWGNSTAITQSGTGALYVDGIYLVFTENGQVWASTDSALNWTRYRMGGNSPTDFIKAATVNGSNICLLGTYEMTRYTTKIMRGI